MEFVTGVRKKETLELSKVLAPQSLDQEVPDRRKYLQHSKHG